MSAQFVTTSASTSTPNGVEAQSAPVREESADVNLDEPRPFTSSCERPRQTGDVSRDSAEAFQEPSVDRSPLPPQAAEHHRRGINKPR